MAWRSCPSLTLSICGLEQSALHATRPQRFDELARQWKGCKREDLQETLATLQVLGKARGVEGGWLES